MTLSPESIVATDIFPVVGQQTTATGTTGTLGTPLLPQQSSQSRRRPDLLLSLSNNLICLFWRGAHYFLIISLATGGPSSLDAKPKLFVKTQATEIDAGAAASFAWIGKLCL